MSSINAQLPAFTMERQSLVEMSVIFPVVLILSLLMHLIYFFTCGKRHHDRESTLPCPGWGHSGVVQKSGRSLLQGKWHVHMSRFLDSLHLPAGFWIALLCIARVWPLFQSHVAAFSVEGLRSSWLHSLAGSELVVELVTHMPGWPLNCWQPLPAVRVCTLCWSHCFALEFFTS